jgi:hypothetical protein
MHGVMKRMKENLEKDGIWPDNLPKRLEKSQVGVTAIL